MADKEKEPVPDEALGFDPSLKKKKKKKKVRIEGEEGEGESVDILAEAVAEVTVREAVKEAGDGDGEGDEPELDLTKKKKKKKKTAEPGGEGEGDQPAKDDGDVELDLTKKKKKKKAAPAEATDDAPPAEEGDGDLDLTKKKKKKKKSTTDEAEPTASEEKPAKKAAKEDDDDDSGDEGLVTIDVGENEMGVTFEDSSAPAASTSVKAAAGPLPWANSDRDYTYDELLQRVMQTLREKNPELSGEKKRFVMKPPQVVREGSKKSTFVNFMEICKIMHRNSDHVYAFIMAELGTSGSIDGNNRMIIKGRFQPKAIESVIRKYVVEYVMCHSCKSPDTIMHKDNRLSFLLCQQCGAQRSVASIKQGFRAQVGRRKKV